MKQITDNEHKSIIRWLEQSSVIVQRHSTTRHDDLMAKRMRETAIKLKKEENYGNKPNRKRDN